MKLLESRMAICRSCRFALVISPEDICGIAPKETGGNIDALLRTLRNDDLAWHLPSTYLLAQVQHLAQPSIFAYHERKVGFLKAEALAGASAFRIGGQPVVMGCKRLENHTLTSSPLNAG